MEFYIQVLKFLIVYQQALNPFLRILSILKIKNFILEHTLCSLNEYYQVTST